MNKKQIEYIRGFGDALESFEFSINKAIEKLNNSEDEDMEEELMSALDSVIATLYIAKMFYDEIVEDYEDSTSITSRRATSEDVRSKTKVMDSALDDIFRDIFTNNKGEC